MSERKAIGIEKKAQTAEINKLYMKSPEGQATGRGSKSDQCYCCEGSYPHKNGQSNCPARGTECTKCGKPNHYARYRKFGNGGENQARNDSNNERKKKPKKCIQRRQHVHTLEADGGDSSSDEGYVFAVRSGKQSPHATVNTREPQCQSPHATVNIHEPQCQSPHATVNIHEPQCQSPHATVNTHEPQCQSPHATVNTREPQCQSPHATVNTHEPQCQSPHATVNTHEPQCQS